MQLGGKLARSGSVGFGYLLLAQQLFLVVRQRQVQVLMRAGCFYLGLGFGL